MIASGSGCSSLLIRSIALIFDPVNHLFSIFEDFLLANEIDEEPHKNYHQDPTTKSRLGCRMAVPPKDRATHPKTQHQNGKDQQG
jgi:hypothetical protein